MNAPAQSPVHSKCAMLVPSRQLADWGVQLTRMERLLILAGQHLGEAIPYAEAARPGIDDLDAFIEGVAALARQLARELEDAQGADEA